MYPRGIFYYTANLLPKSHASLPQKKKTKKPTKTKNQNPNTTPTISPVSSKLLDSTKVKPWFKGFLFYRVPLQVVIQSNLCLKWCCGPYLG